MDWREGRIAKLSDIANRVSADIKKELSGAPPRWATEVTAKWQNGISAQLGVKTRPLCTKYEIPADALTIDQVEVRGTATTVPKMNTRTAIQPMDAIGNVLFVIISSMIGATVFGMGVALAVGGPVTWLLATVAGVFTAFVGKEAAMETLLDTDLYLWIRQMKSAESLKKRLRKDASTFESKLATTFTDEFTKRSKELQDRITVEVEKQLQQRAEDAEMNIS
jgi:hypothetical protein